MILISKITPRTNTLKQLALLCLGAVLLFPCTVGAQSGQVLSVTPPLFQLSVQPGDLWQSSVKVVNGNKYDLFVYAEVVNFEPYGEQGQGRFLPLLGQGDEDRQGTLAEWIEIPSGPHTIAPQQSKEISFFVEVPEDAPPGGHFAAILISTEPPQSEEMAVVTSQAVTSLFFVRIEGDIKELGNIREFTVADHFVETPETEFVLRFENKGNVHLQPQGDIVITNMWGKERGVIPINQQTHFGNVLPETIRAFNFSWKGTESITEIGRYKAEVTLAYGQNGVKSTSAITYFWVIPVKATLITIASIIAFIWFIAWAIKLYIRRMLTLAGVDVDAMGQVDEQEDEEFEETHRIVSYEKVTEPLRSGALDLRQRLSGVREIIDVVKTLTEFVVHYKLFFGSVLIIIVGFVVAVLFIADASKDRKDFEVTIERPDGETVVNSEEIYDTE